MLSAFSQAKRLVVKLGTNILTKDNAQLNPERIASLCRQVSRIRESGVQVIIVSSGAVGLGMGKLGLKRRPTQVEKQQTCAAVGQSILTQTWQSGFDPYGIVVGQMLLTREDVTGRRRHVAIKNALESLLAEGIVPIINENDCISVEELKFGDNDILSALVASLVKADVLAILSTIPGLLNLATNTLVPIVEHITPEIEQLAQGTSSETAVGGMATKISAAKVAAQSGCGTFIGPGDREDILVELCDGKASGTFFLPEDQHLESRKRWLAFFQRPQGSIMVDDGASRALTDQGSSLLAKGIIECVGDFPADSLLEIVDANGQAFARGRSQFSAEDIRRIARKSTEDIAPLFPERKHFEVIHRDELVVLTA